MFVLCLDLKKTFHQFLLTVLKMNDTVNFKDKCLNSFSGYQTRNLHMPGFDKQSIFNNFY